MDDIEKRMLKEVAELDSLPVGAFNIRSNGQSAARNSTANIEIVSKTDKSGNRHYHQGRHEERVMPYSGNYQQIRR